MKVKDIVLVAARTLGIYHGVSAYFEEEDSSLEREANLLLSCFNRVECALALEYVPLYAEDELLTIADILEFSALNYAPVRILGVTDAEGNPLPYKIYPKYIKVQAGHCKVTYTYTPNEKKIDEESDFGVLSANSLFVYGVLTEYCMAEGRFEESATWEKKYKESIEALFRMRSCKRLKSRRWV